MSNRICYECKEHGHLAKDCPRRKEQSKNLAFEDCFSFNIEHKEMIGDTENAFNNFFDTFFKEKQCYEATPVPTENTYEGDSRNNLNMSDKTSKMTKQEAPANYTQATDTECVLVTSNSNFENWLVDSETTLSIDNQDKGLTNMTRCNTEIIVGTGSKTRANKQGYRKFFPVNEDGEEIPTNLNIKVKYVSDFNKKILSLKQLTDLGWDCIYTTTQAYLRKQEDPSIMIPLQMKEDGMFYLRVKKLKRQTRQWTKMIQGRTYRFCANNLNGA